MVRELEGVFGGGFGGGVGVPSLPSCADGLFCGGPGDVGVVLGSSVTVPFGVGMETVRFGEL